MCIKKFYEVSKTMVKGVCDTFKLLTDIFDKLELISLESFIGYNQLYKE